MSRCFPYPPPGYTLSSARKEALIESIKLQKEKVKAEEQRKKEKKREKKEKRKEKKEKKKHNRNQNLEKSDVVQGHLDEKFWTDSKVECFPKGSKAESEQLERSSLTEEHEKPVCLRGPSSSSDSTENSNKRKRHSSPVNVSRGHGNIIRIRLTTKKQNQSESSANEQQRCSTSGRTHFPSQAKDDIAFRHRNEGCAPDLSSINVGQGRVLRTDREQMCSTSKQIESVAEKKLISSATDAVLSPMQKEESLYKNLFENWVPPRWQDACIDTEDEDWLFQGKNEGQRSEKRRICRDESMSCSGASTLWPRAQYLPEVDVYALPFTVPF